MPKSLVLSNGNLLVGYDHYAQVRDFYFPYVGLENHTSGRFLHKIGIWTENRFSWLDDTTWNISITYHPDSLSSQIIASNPSLELEITFTDAVYNEKDIFIRQVTVKNKSAHPRLIKIFFNQQFEIYESFRKDTAYFDPHHQAIIHYKGRRVFLVNAVCDGVSFDDYSTGLISIENREGTFKDAEDGYLSKNPIEHGPVDSVIGVSLNLDPDHAKVIHYWITASKLRSEAFDLNAYVLSRTPAHLLQTTTDFWFAWVNRHKIEFTDLPAEVVNLFKRSLLTIRTHADNHGGIIASCDSDMLQYGRDNYSYVWPRDGAFSAIALDKAGDFEVSKRFFEYCRDIVNPEGYFLHKYRPDQALGSSWHPWVRGSVAQLPIQEDETAAVIFALWQHYSLTRDLEFVESVYSSLIKPCAEFMASYRDYKTGLPLGSYDIWEEKFGTTTFTSSAVYAALDASAKFADLLGKKISGSHYRTAAESVKEGIIAHLLDPISGQFLRMIHLEPDVSLAPDATIDFSSVYGIFRFGVLPPDDERLTRALSWTLSRLGLTTLIGGVARYEGDRYYSFNPHLPGNPWFVTTLWLAQYYLTQAKKPEDTASVLRLLQWTVKHATASGILSEQLNPHTGMQISAAPLTWSHSEFVTTVMDYLLTRSCLS